MTTYADQQDCIHLVPVEENGEIVDYLCTITFESGCAWENCSRYMKRKFEE